MPESNAERFLNAFNSIERHLRERKGGRAHNGFRLLLKEAARTEPALRRYQRDLEQLAELRNAIVHNEYADSRPIADPRDDVVEQIEGIARLLEDPPKLHALFRAHVATVSADDTAGAAAQVMYKAGYAQVPVLDGSRFAALLTAVTLARWIGDHAGEGTVDLNTPIRAVLAYVTHADNYAFLAESQTVFELIETFNAFERRGRRLDAVLISRSGELADRITGIATVADLPRAYRSIQ